MRNFDSGASAYIRGTATVETFFPVDRRGVELVCCDVCRFFRRSSKRCALTEEVIPWQEKYIGHECPLEFKEAGHGES